MPDSYRLFEYVTQKAKQISACYGFSQISTPIFEFTEIFKRTLGEESDVVGKEMYSFDDRGGENITLRPEFTAGIARGFISNGLQNQLPLKFFCTGPLFRYERPQKGRLRQFHQINFELIGVDSPLADIEMIAMGTHIIQELGISDKITLEINSLGDSQSRIKYRDKLVEYLNDYKNDLSDDSKIRLEKNPMRILDSKNEHDKKIVASAPVISDSYNAESADFFAVVKEGLDGLDVVYQLNEKLVRGLDYYCHTAFEFTTDALGSQNAVLAGGRYDGLIATMGGSQTPAVGFAGGIERLSALLDVKIVAPQPISIIPIGSEAEKEALKLAHTLRNEGFYVELGYSGNVKKRMKKAGNANSKAAIIFGDNELEQKIVNLKDFYSGEESQVSASQLLDRLEIYRN